jgi:hypothetical protein
MGDNMPKYDADEEMYYDMIKGECIMYDVMKKLDEMMDTMSDN